LGYTFLNSSEGLSEVILCNGDGGVGDRKTQRRQPESCLSIISTIS